MKRLFQVFLITTLFTLIYGCDLITSNETIIIDGGDSFTKTNSTNYTKVALICNLTKVDPKYYDGWDGDCPGTDVDANIFAKMCSDNKIPYIKLENNLCTIKNIVQKWKDCIANLNPTNGLFIFFYSGHGGQSYASFSDKSETDGLDETLCFWDGQFVDNKVWELLNLQPKTTRCLMVTDCCNSGSNYRLPYNLGKSTIKKIVSRGADPNMLHFGGCNDGESSYGSVRGGEFTAALKATYNKELTYEEWFSKAQKATKLTGYQSPTFAETGISFKTKKIFE